MSNLALEIQKITRHVFLNEENLLCALTHSSFNNDFRKNYERLEFLGDRVLGLVVTEILWDFFPNSSEGELSIRLNGLINAKICAAISIELGLPKFILMGPDMKNLEGRRLENIYADVLEALIAVIYLDGGLNATRPFIEKVWKEKVYSFNIKQSDAKTQLQEWAHQYKGHQPHYRVSKRSGPDHAPIFEVEVLVKGCTTQKAIGSSKRAAERNAAQKLLEHMGVWKKNANR